MDDTNAINSDHSSCTQSRPPLHIPGFYFDVEKNRYFKVLSSDKGCGDNFVTKKTIADKQAECCRLKDLDSFNGRGIVKQRPITGLNKAVPSLPLSSYFRVSSYLLSNGYQRGEVNRTQLERSYVLDAAQCLSFSQKGIFFNQHPSGTRMLQMESSVDCNKLLCVSSLYHDVRHAVQIFNISVPEVSNSARPSRMHLLLEADDESSSIFYLSCKVVHACWCDLGQGSDQHVLCTTLDEIGPTHTSAAIYFVGGNPIDGKLRHDFNLNGINCMAFTCAWNSYRRVFSIGMERSGYVVDVGSSVVQRLQTIQSDVLAQVFMQEEGGNSLFSGTRCGIILKHDLRSRNVVSKALHHPSSVCCLRLSPEETYLYSSDFLGQIKRWDLRMQKVVLSYPGLVNSHYQLPFHIDHTQSVVYAAGADCYCKLWNLKTGELITSIPPPYRASMSSLPVLQFATQWGNEHSGVLGLILGSSNNFFLYTPQKMCGKLK